MFSRKKSMNGTIESLIGETATVEGNIRFRGGLRIDGHVKGSVTAEDGASSMLVLSEQGRIDGEIVAGHVVVNGSINGPVQADEVLELQPKARINGEVRYRSLEIHQGALVDGVMIHLEAERPNLKIAGGEG